MAPHPSKDDKKGSGGGSKKPHSATTTSSAIKVSPDQRFYAFDADKLKLLQEEKPWMTSVKHFQTVAISPSAVTKMMMHCASGVEKGIAKGGNPIEGKIMKI
jgi:hypothetical protein